MTSKSYPLTWPVGWKRTPKSDRKRANFSKSTVRTRQSKRELRELSVAEGVDRVLSELRRMKIETFMTIISTNIAEFNRSGWPRSGIREPDDVGVACYWSEFVEGAPQMCMAIDLYDRVADNLAAIAATLESIRSIHRHGGAEILNRVFTGFTALPPPNSDWQSVLGLSKGATFADADAAYKRARSRCHPDNGGDTDTFNAVVEAWERAQQVLAHG